MEESNRLTGKIKKIKAPSTWGDRAGHNNKPHKGKGLFLTCFNYNTLRVIKKEQKLHIFLHNTIT